MIFTPLDYVNAHRAGFSLDSEGRPQWPGYTPQVKEIPNGDGRVDSEKRYFHVKAVHFDRFKDGDFGPFTERQLEHLWMLFNNGFARATEAAVLLGIPPEFWPAQEACALRVLEYGPGAGSAEHTDFCSHTVNCFRSDSDFETCLETIEGDEPLDDVHCGELLSLMGLPYKSTLHRVNPSPLAQFSIVFFALPKHSAVLPSGVTVGAWLAERYRRSRV
jgi:hypothetical protein